MEIFNPKKQPKLSWTFLGAFAEKLAEIAAKVI